MKLILFEGNPFTGKSTLSEYAAQQLALNGHAVDWVCEGDMLERYFPQVSAMLEQTKPLSDEVLWAEWSAFVQAVARQPAISVVDAAVSYSAVYPLRDDDQPSATIEALVTRLAELCAPLHPRVIYLRGDQDRLARASIVERGPRWERQLIEESDAARYQQARGRSTRRVAERGTESASLPDRPGRSRHQCCTARAGLQWPLSIPAGST